jgi:tetratricopeptide (TPR) repeat protein
VAELSKENIAEAMRAGHVEEKHVEDFIALLDACEFARYSPSAGYEAMSAHYDAALDVISSIDSNMKTKKNTGKAAVMAIIALMILPTALNAQDNYLESVWEDANLAYTEGRWQDAVDGYQLIADASLESAPLWCNLGNAYYRVGNMSKAILCYERSLKIDPSYDDARFNLEFLNSQIQDRIDPVPELILKTWMRKVSHLLDSNSWAVCFLVLLGLTLAMVLMFLLSSSLAGRRTGFFIALVLILLAAASLSFSLWQKNEYMQADKAIVMRPVASVKSSPSYESAKDLFVLHEGTKVTIVDSVGSWNNIELADGRQGWIPSSDLERI